MGIPERVNFDRVADVYDETRAIPEPLCGRALDVMEEFLDSQKRTLDLGVGTGRLALPLQARGYQVTGIDISERMIEVGISNGLENVFLADACCLPFRNKTFQSTLSVHLLHLLPDWMDALREVVRVTRQNLITLAYFWSEEDTPYGCYEKLISESGCSMEHVGLHERYLPDKIPPLAREFVGSEKRKIPADEAIRRLRDKVYSRLWKVPRDVHKNAIKELEERFEGKEIPIQGDIYILVWDIDNLRADVERLGASNQSQINFNTSSSGN